MKLRDFSLGKVCQAGLMVGGLEICWNLVFGRIPVYLYQPLRPGLAIPLNALVHLGVTAALFSLLGFIIYLLPVPGFKRNCPAVTVTLWSIYLGLTVLARYQNLKLELSAAASRVWQIAVILALAAGAFFLVRRLARSRSPGWTGFFVVSLYTTAGSLLLRLPLHPLSYLLPYLSALALLHLLTWLLFRKRAAGLTAPATVIVILAILGSAGRGIW